MSSINVRKIRDEFDCKSIARREYLIYESYNFKREIWDINILKGKLAHNFRIIIFQ